MIDVNAILGNSGAADNSKAKLAADFDNFLALLTTQLQYQDPLDPMDSNQFTEQLVQFTNVEQSIAQNKNLENIAALTAFNGINASVSFLGRDITVQQSENYMKNGQANWIYELQGGASKTTLSVLDANGTKVYEQEGAQIAGSHGFTWNGLDQLGNPLPEGTYELKVTAKDINDDDVPSNIFIRANVDAVDISTGEAFLEANGFQIPLANVLAVQPKAEEAPAG